MNIDSELHDWQRQWRGQSLPGTTAAELAAGVRHGTRVALASVVVAVLVTVGVLGPLLVRAWQGFIDPRFAGGILLMVALVWATTLWVARGTWRPRDESTAAFLELSIRRCRSAIVGAPVGIALYVAELAYVLLAAHRLEGVDWPTLLRSAPVIAVGWIGGPLFIAGQLWYAHRQRARLARLRELQAELSAG